MSKQRVEIICGQIQFVTTQLAEVPKDYVRIEIDASEVNNDDFLESLCQEFGGYVIPSIYSGTIKYL